VVEVAMKDKLLVMLVDLVAVLTARLVEERLQEVRLLQVQQLVVMQVVIILLGTLQVAVVVLLEQVKALELQQVAMAVQASKTI
jgi:hypothetical protein